MKGLAAGMEYAPLLHGGYSLAKGMLGSRAPNSGVTDLSRLGGRMGEAEPLSQNVMQQHGIPGGPPTMPQMGGFEGAPGYAHPAASMVGDDAAESLFSPELRQHVTPESLAQGTRVDTAEPERFGPNAAIPHPDDFAPGGKLHGLSLPDFGKLPPTPEDALSAHNLDPRDTAYHDEGGGLAGFGGQAAFAPEPWQVPVTSQEMDQYIARMGGGQEPLRGIPRATGGLEAGVPTSTSPDRIERTTNALGASPTSLADRFEAFRAANPGKNMPTLVQEFAKQMEQPAGAQLAAGVQAPAAQVLAEGVQPKPSANTGLDAQLAARGELPGEQTFLPGMGGADAARGRMAA